MGRGGGGGERYMYMCRDVMIILLTTSLHVYIPHSWHYRTCPQASPDGITSPLYRTHIIRIRRGCGLNSTGLNGSCTKVKDWIWHIPVYPAGPTHSLSCAVQEVRGGVKGTIIR